MHSYKKDLVCSKIMINENAAPMTLLVMDPWYSCEKQAFKDFHS